MNHRPHNWKHGLTKHPLFNTWQLMRSRCHDQKNNAYQWYGARGIKVCKRWKTSFKNFLDWAMKHGWQPGLSIERKNNDAGYSPTNCCFVPRGRQARNRRSNKLNEPIVAEIRQRYKDGETVTGLARVYYVSPNNICRIVHNKIWK